MSQHRLSSGAVLRRMVGYLAGEYSLTWAVLSPGLIVLESSEHFRESQWDPSLEPVGRHISELFWELIGSEAGLTEVLEGKEESFCLENINRDTENHSTIYLSLTAIPLDQRESKKGLLLIIQDTTFTSSLKQQLVQDRNELRLVRNKLSQANEELRKLNRLKSLFLSIAAHDLRAPLTAIYGYTELVIATLSEETNPEANEYLSINLSLVDSLNRLISDFIDLDIIEQGNLKIWPVLCNLNVIVREVADIMNAVASRKGVLIETRLRQDLPAIYADPDRIRQILFNLTGNAIKYTGEGDAVIIETDIRESCALLTVTDHGPGIPETEIPQLFDLYHRTEDARQSKKKGLGLGLFIVKSLVDLHHGQIATYSELGKGTEFTVSLPLHQSETEGHK